MPGKGSPIIRVRVPREMHATIQAIIDASPLTRRAGPWTWSEWLLDAARYKLAHRERSKGINRRAARQRKLDRQRMRMGEAA